MILFVCRSISLMISLSDTFLIDSVASIDLARDLSALVSQCKKTAVKMFRKLVSTSSFLNWKLNISSRNIECISDSISEVNIRPRTLIVSSDNCIDLVRTNKLHVKTSEISWRIWICLATIGNSLGPIFPRFMPLCVCKIR